MRRFYMTDIGQVRTPSSQREKAWEPPMKKTGKSRFAETMMPYAVDRGRIYRTVASPTGSVD